jgi:hypothetical protein
LPPIAPFANIFSIVNVTQKRAVGYVGGWRELEGCGWGMAGLIFIFPFFLWEFILNPGRNWMGCGKADEGGGRMKKSGKWKK